MKDGFIKIALASPIIRVADTEYNADVCIKAAEKAAQEGAKIIVFPELVLTGATCAHLFLSDALLSGALAALGRFARETKELDLISFVGFPFCVGTRIFDGVAAVLGGEIINVSVCSSLSPELSSYFSSAAALESSAPTLVEIFGSEFLCAEPVIYKHCNAEGSATDLRIFVEVGGDAHSLTSMSASAALAGATVIINPFAEPEYLGAADGRLTEALAASSRLSSVYVRVGAGLGESGTDGVYSAQRIAASCGELLLNAKPFDSEIVYTVADLGKCVAERRRREDFKEGKTADFYTPTFTLADSVTETPIYPKFPFVPKSEDKRREACELALEIQSYALAERMRRAYARCAVLGVSGGLDSTLAVLVAARAADILGLPRTCVIAITMPCFGTSKRTKSNALLLAGELGCTLRTIDIKAAVERHFKDIGQAPDCYDVVYENSQARERTQILMDVANKEGGMVIGTGDLSELALGFATYNGDHMSMYGVNSSVPKTLMRAIILHAADVADKNGEKRLSKVLRDVVDTPVSPELLPISGEENAQYTESIVGPYELHDFFLYYAVKYGYTREKILRLATAAFAPDYDGSLIEKYLDIFFRRFFTQQFKRSCMPDGPRVSEISLSPRGAWRMPSDASGALWKK